MRVPVDTPEFSESVQSGTLLEWRRQEGDAVARDEVLAELETDKVILELTAPAAGVLARIHVEAGSEVRAGMTLAEIETEVSTGTSSGAAQKDVLLPSAPAESADAELAAPEPTVPGRVDTVNGHDFENTPRSMKVMSVPSPPAPLPQAGEGSVVSRSRDFHVKETLIKSRISESRLKPLPQNQWVAEADLVMNGINQRFLKAEPSPPMGCTERARTSRRVAMTRLRQRIAERMLEAQRTAAILTTFNEIDMRPVQELRQRYQERFQREHGVKLGLMSFFVKAACQALKAYPILNARVEGSDIVYHDYYDIGVAVSSERGLVVPVLRDADTLSFAAIEQAIADFARRANTLELRIEELDGGTFTISNGGVFGSLLSTPILNPPQSGVLGLHRIQERPVAIDGQAVIRPMMYVALSYDHRIVDGREAVSFLRVLKEAVEDPASLLLEL